MLHHQGGHLVGAGLMVPVGEGAKTFLQVHERQLSPYALNKMCVAGSGGTGRCYLL